MKLIENELYQEDLKAVAEFDLPWEKLNGKAVLLSGATGMIGSFLVDVLLYRNKIHNMGCTVLALGRNGEKARERFSYCFEDDDFRFIAQDINQPLSLPDLGKVDYVLHLASNTHPVAYATDPIGTILTNIEGTKNLLDFAVEHRADRFAFASSNEIYGENRGDVERFDESYCGYIDCNTLRAGYPESKRCGEALCQAYRKQKGLDVVIPRLTRSFGPTMLMSDTKAISQFILKAVKGEDIVLKSAGTQYYSFTYVADAVSGLLTVLLKGENEEAYNIADESGDIMLKDLAELIAECAGTRVVYDLPDVVEAAGFSKATKARLDGAKTKALGWTSSSDLPTNLKKTVDILKHTEEK